MTVDASSNRRAALHLLTAAAGMAAMPSMALSEGSKNQNGRVQQASTRGAVVSGMHVRPIPASGEAIPVLGLGTWQTFSVDASPSSRSPLVEVMREFVRLGGKVIDSSPMYGTSEQVAGDIIEQLELRERLFIATKVWTSGKQDGIQQMRSSMAKLRANPVDLMQVHNLLDLRTHMGTLAEWKKAGLVRYVGVTHYTASAHDAVARAIESFPVDFIQINYSVGEREAEARLLPMAREKGIAVIVNRPFAGGSLFSRLRATPVPSWASEIGCSTWAQLLLKFVISHTAVTCAIPATSKVGHLRDNMQAGVGPLPDEAMRRRIINAAVS